MINIETEKMFLKKLRNLQEEFDNRILDLKKEFYNSQKVETEVNTVSLTNLIVEKSSTNLKIDTLKKNKKSNDELLFKIVDDELYKEQKMMFNREEDFMSYNHIIGYYTVERDFRDYWFRKIIFDHFNRLKEFFDNNDLSFLDYKSILGGVGIKIIKTKSKRKEYAYKSFSFEELESKLQYYYSTNNKKWFRRFWNQISEYNPDKVILLKIKYKPILSALNIV
jgi:hypothetical protein